MISAEQLINDLNKQIAKLEEEIKDLKQDMLDFERLAHVWKKAYEEEIPRLKKQIVTLNGVIDQMDKELSEER